MNNLTIKPVRFFGSELLAIKNEKGEIYAAVNPILRGLGFSEKQVEYQRDKWLSDKAIAKGTQKFSGILFGMGTGRDTWAITLKKLPFALAKLAITPTMERELPELSDTLEKYQDECADVLAAAFLPSNQPKTYPVKATSVGEVASLVKVNRLIMKDQKSSGTKIARQTELFFKQFGVESIPDYVEPSFEQMTLTTTTREITTKLTLPHDRNNHDQLS